MKTKTVKKLGAGYVDGFVFRVPKHKVAAYKKMAREGKEAWMKFGALDYKECKGDDLATLGMDGKSAPLTFVKLTGVKPTETVWFSFITFKNKAHRNAVNKKVIAYFDKQYAKMKNVSMPFDESQMARGGFTVEVG
jgi:alkaline phosphatase